MAIARTGKYAGRISELTIMMNGGSVPTVFTGIMSVKIIAGEQLVPFTGDAAVFNTALARVLGSRGLQISGYDVSQFLRTLPPGPCTIVATVLDAINDAGLGSGAVTYTLLNAMRSDMGASHQNQSADSASVTYMSFADDGLTDPLTVSEE